MTDPRHYMAQAIRLAERGLYTTHPNPRVGCVLVREGRVVGEGYHQRAGEPHAEVHALRAAGEQAKGATAYVSLEPCAHFGRTPPCADALIAAGVARVVVATLDPNPLVAGQGVQKLQAAGIAVEVGLLAEEARALNPGFLRRMAGGLPWVRLKMAASLDGRTAMASGESKWITGSAARADVQRWRARSGAVMCGVGTVLADDPELTVRPETWPDWPCGSVEQPLRIILDSEFRTPRSARVLKGGTLIIGCRENQERIQDLQRSGADIALVAEESGRPSPRAVLELLAARGVNEVLLETGATLAGSFVEATLVDQIILYLAPTFLGSSARPLLDLPLTFMAQQRHLKIDDVRMVGSDLRLLARPE